MRKLIFILSAASVATGLLCGCNTAALSGRTAAAGEMRSMDNFGGVLSVRQKAARPVATGRSRALDNFGGVL